MKETTKNNIILALTIVIVLAVVILVGNWLFNTQMAQLEQKTNALEDIKNGLDIQRFHDDEKNVTCWYSDSGSLSVPPTISCIPDSQLKE